ncbi:MAG TPA: hypothetical protein VGQ53_02180 [Chitinophagaceae bacterium]|nr:hypothetical protein [Chitinophagaceae bacterium]
MKQYKRTRPQPRTRSKGLIIFSRVASFVFHPFFMTSIAAVLIYKLAPSSFRSYSSSAIRIFIEKLSVFSVLLPFLAVFLFRKLNLISDTKMHEASDRIYPLLTALVFYTTAYWLLARTLPVFIHSLLFGSCLSIFILFIITNFYKISVHTTAAAILPGVCVVLMLSGKTTMVPLLFASLIAIIVGIVRWLLGAHTIGQILLGYLTGIFTQLGAYYYLH